MHFYVHVEDTTLICKEQRNCLQGESEGLIFSYLHAIRMAFQVKKVEVNDQLLVKRNRDLINTIKVAWIVVRISRTSQGVVLDRTTICWI